MSLFEFYYIYSCSVSTLFFTIYVNSNNTDQMKKKNTERK